MPLRWHDVAQIHHALRFDATERQVIAALQYDMDRCDILDVTEVGSDRMQRILRGVAHAHGWRLHAPGDRAKRETSVLWNPAVVNLEYADTFQPTTRRLDTHRGGEMWCHGLLFSIVGHRAAQWWVAAGHAPAHVQGPRGFRELPRWAVSVAVYHAYLSGIKRRMKGRKPRVLALDWNLNLKAGWVRGYIAARFPGARCSWRRPWPKGGTHHRRIIDWLLLRGLRLVKASRLLRKFPGLDHRAVLTVYAVPDPAH